MRGDAVDADERREKTSSGATTAAALAVSSRRREGWCAAEAAARARCLGCEDMRVHDPYVNSRPQ
jgi:hypothetical protein